MRTHIILKQNGPLPYNSFAAYSCRVNFQKGIFSEQQWSARRYLLLLILISQLYRIKNTMFTLKTKINNGLNSLHLKIKSKMFLFNFLRNAKMFFFVIIYPVRLIQEQNKDIYFLI